MGLGFAVWGWGRRFRGLGLGSQVPGSESRI